MSELLENRKKKREILKHAIMQLHNGSAPEQVRNQISRMLGEVPYDDVVAVEQELIAEGISTEEILKLCDLHAAVLKDQISLASAKQVPPGHPVDVFKKENSMLRGEIALMRKSLGFFVTEADVNARIKLIDNIAFRLRNIWDIDKHYKRKENLLFPFLEKKGITGPPKVMWGKDDEVRDKIKAAIESIGQLKAEELVETKTVFDMLILPALEAVEDMIYREEEILLPMSLDELDDSEWYEIHNQSPEIGFCLYDPDVEWSPEGIKTSLKPEEESSDRINLPSGSFTKTELNTILNTIPFDLTFVDKDDTVRYFTQGEERIFNRNRAIIGRKVQFCHPPSSVHIVQQILNDFKNGKENRAPFWIELNGKFIHIEYFALRDKKGNYLGTLEVSQDLTKKRKLQGEQRLLSYEKGNNND